MEFQFGDWLVSPEANVVSNGEVKTQLEPRVMAVLRYLCRHPGAVIPAEEILQACWGSSELGDNPVHKAITQLRRAFGDSSTEPRYIETIRKRGYRAIAPVVTLAAPPSTVWEGGSPFRGLEAFQENHAAIFFGRVQATAQLRELVMTQAAHGCPMALVLGPSGSGKTSLVRAGLLPHLMAGATRSDEPVGLTCTVYLDCADLGSGTLFQALAGALIDADINGEPLFLGASADSLGQQLAEEPDTVAAELRQRACTRPIVGVFVDRLEAIFRAPSGESDRFMATVDALSKSNCLLMLMACRNDFYPEVMAQPVLLGLKTRGGHFDVLPPDGADIAQMVRQPAQSANLTFEKDGATGASLDDVLCDATRGNPDMLPLLQYLLNELYRQRSEDGVLLFDVYRQLDGIEGAVGVRAEQVVSQLTPPQIEALPHVLSLLVNVSDEQSAVTSRRSPLSMLRTEDEKELVRVMVEARLFVSELSGDVPSFGVAHEALLRRWGRVAEWIEHYRNFLQLRSRLESQAQRWHAASRSSDLLLPGGTQVVQASELLSLKDFALTNQASEYVRASLRRAKLGERIRLAVTALILILAVSTTIFGVTARSAQKQAELSQGEAEDLMTYMLGEFVEKLRPIGRLELLDNVSKKAMDYLGKTGSSADPRPALVHRAKALRLLGEVHVNRGRPDEAVAAYNLGRELLGHLPPEIAGTPAALRERAINSFMIGQIQLQRNEISKAEDYFKEYVDFSDRFAAAAPNDPEAWLEQSYAHSSLGTLNLKRNDYSQAASQFKESLTLKQRAQKLKPNDAALSVDMANSYSWLAEANLKLGKLAEARELYAQEEALLRPVHQGNGTWSQRLALSYWRQGLLQAAMGDQTLALKSLNEAEALFERLVKSDSSNRTWQSRLNSVRGRKIELLAQTESPAALLPHLEGAQRELATLIEQDPKNSAHIYQSAWQQQMRGLLLAKLNRADEARASVQAAISILQKQIELGKQDKVTLSFLADALLAKAELTKADNSERLSLCAKAQTLVSDTNKETTDFALLALQVRANLCSGNFNAASEPMRALEKMGYREMRYKQFLSSQLKR